MNPYDLFIAFAGHRVCARGMSKSLACTASNKMPINTLTTCVEFIINVTE